MSLSTFAHMAETVPPRRRGRPSNAETPGKRELQLKVVGLYLTGTLLAKQAAAAAGITRQQLRNWVVELTAGDSPEAAALRKLDRRS